MEIGKEGVKKDYFIIIIINLFYLIFEKKKTDHHQNTQRKCLTYVRGEKPPHWTFPIFGTAYAVLKEKKTKVTNTKTNITKHLT